MTFTRGDNNKAFNNTTVKVNLTNDDNYVITKAVVLFINDGNVVSKVYENPVFPIDVELTSEDSSKLKAYNTIKLILFDAKNRQYTCPQEGSLQTNPQMYGGRY